MKDPPFTCLFHGFWAWFAPFPLSFSRCITCCTCCWRSCWWCTCPSCATRSLPQTYQIQNNNFITQSTCRMEIHTMLCFKSHKPSNKTSLFVTEILYALYDSLFVYNIVGSFSCTAKFAATMLLSIIITVHKPTNGTLAAMEQLAYMWFKNFNCYRKLELWVHSHFQGLVLFILCDKNSCLA